MEKALAITSNKKLSNNLIIYLGLVSVFLPYYVSFVFLVLASVYIFVKKRNFNLLKQNKIPWLIFFISYSVLIAAVNKNYNGILYSLFILLLSFYCIYIKSIMTPKVFEKVLKLSAWLGLITAIIGIADKIAFMLFGDGGKYRLTLYFFNCNYLATVFAIVIVICAYKIILCKGNYPLYFTSAILCAVAMYLTGSMFVWIEVFIGIAFLLKYTRKSQLFSILLLALATIIIVLYCAPSIIPRFSDIFKTVDNRVGIWQTSIDSIKSTPLFGRGFMTYKHIRDLYPGAYPTSHSHNIILQFLMDFGIIGTGIVMVYLYNLFHRLNVCRKAQSKYYFSSLILALLFGLIAHGLTDLTFLWSQTGLFYGLIICGINPEEKLLNI